MVFSSPVFLFRFLPFVLLLYFLMPRAWRNLLLLGASLFFYAWGEGVYFLLMVLSIGINFFAGLWVDRTRDKDRGKITLGIAIAINLALLAWYKYANFFADNLNFLLHGMGVPAIHIDRVHLPAGISFFTFHAISYLVDVYRRDTAVIKRPTDLALYVSLFPQLIAGPIVRYRDVAEQIISRKVSVEGFAEGVRRFIMGLGKKVLIANVVAVPADGIFGLPYHELTPGMAWLGILSYTLQIYFDFSGYSDMAIGIGLMFGFRFRENFNYPYISSSMTEFWRRWHISLSTWFRDYLYIPLGGNRLGKFRTFVNLYVVFFLTGLWHGASWNFVIWGLFHGTFLVIERLGRDRAPRPYLAPLKHAYTLLVAMSGWVLFRADSLPQALAFLKAMAGFATGTGVYYFTRMYLDSEIIIALIVGIIGSAPLLPMINRLRDQKAIESPTAPSSAMDLVYGLGSTVALALILFACAMQLAASTHNPFIYFRF